MSEVTSRIPFDRTSGKYKKDWQGTQAEQVSKRHSKKSCFREDLP